jgi:glycosyltransferase involved in cell wall biosynthesis
MLSPSIGIVTPSYNQASFIRRTIDSILDQKYPSLVYWVIDGGSTDGTIDILKSYGKKINWISEKDAGQTSAINKGMKRLSTDVVCYINSDDVFVAGSLERVGEIFNKNSIDWLVGSYQIIDEQDEIISSQTFIPVYKKFLLKHYSPFILKSTNSIIPQPSTFWSMRAMKKIGYFNESLRYTMDYEYWLRLSEYYSPMIIPQILSKFRIHATSKSGSQYKKQFAEELVVIRQRSNPIEYTLHWLHTQATLLMYQRIK